MMPNQWSIYVHVVARYSRPPVERKVMEESWLTWFRVRSPVHHLRARERSWELTHATEFELSSPTKKEERGFRLPLQQGGCDVEVACFFFQDRIHPSKCQPYTARQTRDTTRSLSFPGWPSNATLRMSSLVEK